MNKDLMFSSHSNEWETPLDLFRRLDREFHFTLDPCSTKDNHKCKKYYTKIDDGLHKSWRDETVFVNPPYRNELGRWVEKCFYENKQNNIIIVMLIPVRTDTNWFHKYIYNKTEIRFIHGRLKFINRTLPSFREDGNFKKQQLLFLQ